MFPGRFFRDRKRVIVKIGSSSLRHSETGDIDYTKIERLVRELCDLRGRGMDVCLVSSGAIAVGRMVLSLSSPPDDTATKQACAAVGQARLMMTYQKLFAEYNHTAAQVLLTKETMFETLSRRNARNTLERLFALGAIPVVNENDTISTYEMRFGDNDTLAALVASLMEADLLIMLSDIDGLYTDDPRRNPRAELVEVVEEPDGQFEGMAKGSTGSDVGTGGMETKLSAARIATSSGADMVIANGRDVGIIHRIIGGEFRGTLFRAKKDAGFDIRRFLDERS